MRLGMMERTENKTRFFFCNRHGSVDSARMKQNLFAQIPPEAAQELMTELLSANNVRIERIVSFGQASPEGFWYDQPENEWILLLEGSAQLLMEDALIDLKSGDFLNIPAGCRHRVQKTDQNVRTVWLAVFYKK